MKRVSGFTEWPGVCVGSGSKATGTAPGTQSLSSTCCSTLVLNIGNAELVTGPVDSLKTELCISALLKTSVVGDVERRAVVSILYSCSSGVSPWITLL